MNPKRRGLFFHAAIPIYVALKALEVAEKAYIEARVASVELQVDYIRRKNLDDHGLVGALLVDLTSMVAFGAVAGGLIKYGARQTLFLKSYSRSKSRYVRSDLRSGESLRTISRTRRERILDDARNDAVRFTNGELKRLSKQVDEFTGYVSSIAGETGSRASEVLGRVGRTEGEAARVEVSPTLYWQSQIDALSGLWSELVGLAYEATDEDNGILSFDNSDDEIVEMLRVLAPDATARITPLLEVVRTEGLEPAGLPQEAVRHLNTIAGTQFATVFLLVAIAALQPDWGKIEPFERRVDFGLKRQTQFDAPMVVNGRPWPYRVTWTPVGESASEAFSRHVYVAPDYTRTVSSYAAGLDYRFPDTGWQREGFLGLSHERKVSFVTTRREAEAMIAYVAISRSVAETKRELNRLLLNRQLLVLRERFAFLSYLAAWLGTARFPPPVGFPTVY